MMITSPLSHRKLGAFERIIEWYQLAPVDKIALIRRGIPARSVRELAQAMKVPQHALFNSLALSRSTVNRRVQRNQVLSPADSERVAGMQELIGRAHAMWKTSDGFPRFDAAHWIGQWLFEPLPALGGRTAASYLDTLEGQRLILDLLGRMESGAYS